MDKMRVMWVTAQYLNYWLNTLNLSPVTNLPYDSIFFYLLPIGIYYYLYIVFKYPPIFVNMNK